MKRVSRVSDVINDVAVQEALRVLPDIYKCKVSAESLESFDRRQFVCDRASFFSGARKNLACMVTLSSSLSQHY